jgi:hypothetical protein
MAIIQYQLKMICRPVRGHTLQYNQIKKDNLLVFINRAINLFLIERPPFFWLAVKKNEISL